MSLTRVIRRALLPATTISLLFATGAVAKPAKPPVVSSVTVSNASVAAGDSLTATATVKNPGRRHSTKRDVYFYLVAAVGAAPKTPQGAGVGTVRAVRIAAGATKRVTSPAIHVPSSSAGGSFYVLGCTAGKCKSSLLRVAAPTTQITNAGTPGSGEAPAELSFNENVTLYPSYANSVGYGAVQFTNIGQATTGELTADIETADGEATWGIYSNGCHYLAAGSSCTIQVQMNNGPTPGVTNHGTLRIYMSGDLMGTVTFAGPVWP